jgi:FKBP-type peptidyl-prolyl cis-trans isomerase
LIATILNITGVTTMNRLMTTAAACAVLASAAATAQQEVTELDSAEDRLSYTIGMDIGQSLAGQEMPLDIDILMQGLRDSYLGEETLLTQEEARSEREQFIQQRQQRLAEQRSEEAQVNLEEGQAFLAANADKEGVTVTDSGLQYRVIEEGEGPRPDADDRVTVHYRGTLINGVEFDSSYARDEPATFGLNQVIPGWTEGLQLMREGATYEFFIPSDLAYGEQGRPGPIGPNSTLIFEVELLEVQSSDDSASE